MSAASMSPDVAWMVGAVATAAITTGPAYMAARRSRGAAREEGAATRDALSAVRDELRSDIAEVREWQAAHTTEHAINALNVDLGRRARVERRTNNGASE
jgi:hypothetical protein